PDFLEPTLRKFLPDPSHLKDMDAAIARLVRAVQQGEQIVVFGDYDVDGATSSALLLRFVRSVGGTIGVYIPDRRKEGYGPNAPALLKLKAEGAAVVVTVDCGVTAYEPLAEAAKAGLDVIVIDHHQAEMVLPQALAVVDPNRIDDVSALALRLDEFNSERRAIEREVLDQAVARIEGLYGPDRKGLPAALIVESKGWHVGVIGIVASRLVERYGRPAFVIGMDGEV